MYMDYASQRFLLLVSIFFLKNSNSDGYSYTEKKTSNNIEIPVYNLSANVK